MIETQTMTHDFMELPLEVKTGDAPGTFEGYGAIFGNVDRDGDVVAKGAFADSLKGGRVPALLWQHNAKEPIGRFDMVREDARGLYVKGRLAMTGRGLEAYALLKMGALDGLSIGFVTKEAARDSVRGVRTITRAELMEISLVTFPANDLARISTVKGQAMQDGITDVRSFERFLRENGFSRTRAKTIATKGFRAGEEDIPSFDELVAGVRAKTRSLALMTKGVQQVTLEAKVRDYGDWKMLTYVNPPVPSKFKLSVRKPSTISHESAFEVQVKYMSPQGERIDTWMSNADPNYGKAYEIPAGMQEIWVRAKSYALPLYVTVSFIPVL